MSVFDVDSNIESIDDNIRKYHEDRLKKTGYWYTACVQSKNDLHQLDNIYNGMVATVYNENYRTYVCIDGDWIKMTKSINEEILKTL